jgi:hypothetical protein
MIYSGALGKQIRKKLEAANLVSDSIKKTGIESIFLRN